MNALESLTIELEALILAANGAKLTEYQAGYIAGMKHAVDLLRGKI